MPRPSGKQREKWSTSAELDEDQLTLRDRARAQLRLPYLDANGNPWEAESEMPTIETLILRLSRLVRMFDPEKRFMTEPGCRKWSEEKREIEENIQFFKRLKTWSADQYQRFRAQFLGETGLDLDTGLLLRGEMDADAVHAIMQMSVCAVVDGNGREVIDGLGCGT